jgi:ArsR family transcriptional regulator, cadmium/lead-responsive transcriptional repressor
MDVSPDLDPVTIGLPRPASPPSGCDLDCKERLFRTLANRGCLRILDLICEGARTVEQIAAVTGLSQVNASIQLQRLVDCGWVRPNRTPHSLLYTLSTPRFLQLEAVVDEFLVASLKVPDDPSYD